MEITKICKICNRELLLSCFHPNKQCSLGVVGTCRDCTHKRISQWYADNKEARQESANNIKRRNKAKAVAHFGNKCADCGGVFPQCVYQFHHLDATQKDINPSESFARKEAKMWEELKKCVMLCANCHMIRHYVTDVGKEGVDATTH